MKSSTTTRLAWSVTILSFGMIVADLWLIAIGPSGLPLAHPDKSAAIDYLEPVMFLVVGLIVAWKRPENRVGWLMLAYAGGRALLGFLAAYGEHGVSVDPGSLPGAGVAVWITTWVWMPHLVLLPLILFHFPNGRLPSAGWRWAIWCCAVPGALMIAAGIGWLSVPPRELILAGADGLPGAKWTQVMFTLAFIAAIALSLVSVVSLFVRYRRTHGDERNQLKWVFLAAAVLVVQGIQSELLPWDDVDAVLGSLLFAAVPAAIGVAILKYRLYDIDRIINRTLVYGLLTATLALGYVLIVVTLQRVTDPFTGSNQAAIAASTLLVAALFRPVRDRIQHFIDVNFYRSRYDATKILEGFSAQLRDSVDLEALSGELLTTVGQTVQPAHASLWIRPPSDRLTGS
jgi:hypothetical protein